MWTGGNRKFVTLYGFLFLLDSTHPFCPLWSSCRLHRRGTIFSGSHCSNHCGGQKLLQVIDTWVIGEHVKFSHIISHMFCLFPVCRSSLPPEGGLCERETLLFQMPLWLSHHLGILPGKYFLCHLVFYSPLVIGAITGRMKEGCKLFVKQMVVSTCLYHTWESGTPGLTVLESGHICFRFKFWNKDRSLKWSYGGCQTRLQRHEKSLLRFLLRYYFTGVNKMASPSIRDKKNRSLS